MQDEPRPEIGLKQAVQEAIKSVSDLYEAQGYQLNDLLLEEVQRSGGNWLVTVGFTRPMTSAGATVASALVGVAARRAFKRVKIDGNTGEFLEMQIRELQTSPSSQPR